MTSRSHTPARPPSFLVRPTLPGQAPPGPSAFTASERRLIRRLRAPEDVQHFLNTLPYNTEPPPEPATLRSFRGVVARQTANCIEAALTASVILEQHGYAPLVMSLESIDALDHVIFIYQHRGRWGSIARSRDPGLHGRRPVFPSLRALAMDYVDPYVDKTGCIKGYGPADLRALGNYNWRLSSGNVWKVERYLLELPHHPIRWSPTRLARLRRKYLAYVRAHDHERPRYYDRRAWTEIPTRFAKAHV